MSEKVLYSFLNTDLENAILGPLNKNIKIIENKLKCHLVVTQNDIIGDERYEKEILDITIQKGTITSELQEFFKGIELDSKVEISLMTIGLKILNKAPIAPKHKAIIIAAL